MEEVGFHYKADDPKITFAVVITKYNCGWIMCKRKGRTTYEFPSGRRKAGESIYDTAKREIKEETGAEAFSLKRICDFSVRDTECAGEEPGEEKFGTLFFARMFVREFSPQDKTEEVDCFDDLPDDLTYPSITQKLVDRAMIEILMSEDGSAYFLVHDKDLPEYPFGGDPFVEWLKSEGFKWHKVYHSTATGIWISLNNKIMACGKPGIRCFEEIGHHAITVEEFKTIYGIFKKYRGKAPFVFD